MPKPVKGTLLKVLAVLASSAMLAGCASTPAAPADDRRVVVTTFTVIADMVRAVGGEEVVVESITKVGAEIHGYEPTPSDLRRAENADLIIDNGLGLERWFEEFIERIDAPRVVASEGIDPVNIRIGAYEGAPNPHAWMSPVAGQLYIDNIATALSELMPSSAGVFEANASVYKAELQELAQQLRDSVDALPREKRVLVTCEGAFSYLARDLGLTEGYLWPVNSDSQGTPQQIKAAIDLVRDNAVPAVFCETTVNDSSMQQVARESGARFGGSLYVDSLSLEDGPVASYLELLRYDIDLIVDGLSGD